MAASALAPKDSTPKFVAPKTIPELEARIRHVLDSAKVPGIGLAIVRHDSVIYTGGLGLARVAPRVKATDATLFRIGSTSKAFVALTAQALVREGKLSLDTPLAKALPGFWFKNAWEATDPVRIVNLLEHTSGFDDNSLKSYANSDPTPLKLADGLALDSITRVSRWRPGTRFSYCNTGPAIVALIIEKIEGKPFEQVVQERWFDPIGMKTATYFKPDSASAATLYMPNGTTAVPYWYVFIRPAGSINASSHDMAAYVRFLLGRGTIDGKELLPRAAIERMEHSESWLGARAGLKVGYGLHLYRMADSTGFTWTAHNGGVEGGLSDMSYLPDYGVGYAFQINSGNADAFRLITRLVRAYMTQGLTPPTPASVVRVAHSTADRFSGWYRLVSPRAQHLYILAHIPSIAEVSFTDTAMRFAPWLDDEHGYVPVDSLRFRRKTESEATLAFVRDAENQRPAGIEMQGGGLFMSLTRISTLDAVVSMVCMTLWVASLALSFLAMVFGGVRWVVRRSRRRPTPRAAVAVPWRLAAIASACVAANFVFAMLGSGDVQTLGRVTWISVSVLLAGYLYCVFALILVRTVWATPGGGRWARVSLWSVRAVAVLHVIAAAYLVSMGWIGWRTWA
jgi:CubicO group peptidase (beta-lactamase class C family)